MDNQSRKMIRATQRCNMMMHANIYFVMVLLDPVSGMADEPDGMDRYRDVDLDDEQQARRVIRELLVPEASGLHIEARKRIEVSLRFFLSKEETPWGRVLESNLVPFATPNDPKRFFEILFEMCFGIGNNEIGDITQCIESNDANEVLRLATELKRREKER